MTQDNTTAAAGWRFYLPYFVADVILLLAAWLIYNQASRPMTVYEVSAFGVCVSLGAFLGTWPFTLRQRVELKLLETSELGNCVDQIAKVEDVAERIERASGQWQSVQEVSQRTMLSAKEISERMATESKDFIAFMEKANDAERNHLRLEVEKLRRGEGDWLQVVVRLMDHSFALYNAALRSGQPLLVQQIGQFLNACRDSVRRVGLQLVFVEPGTPYDSASHQLADPNVPAPAGAVVSELVATGLTFQGRLIRPPVVLARVPTPTLPDGALPATSATSISSGFGAGANLSADTSTVTLTTSSESAPDSGLSVSDINKRKSQDQSDPEPGTESEEEPPPQGNLPL